MFADEVLRDVLSPEEEAEVRLSIAAMYSLRADLRVNAGRIALALPEVSKAAASAGAGHSRPQPRSRWTTQ
jgi:hypothetical protein